MLVDLIIYLNLQNMLKRIFGHRFSSNICGNPYAIDPLLTAMAGPYPELNDFNAIATGLPLHKPLVLIGKVPRHARYWSIQLYLDNVSENAKDQTLLDTDVRLSNPETGEFVVVVSRKEAKPDWCYLPSDHPIPSTSTPSPVGNWIEVPSSSSSCILVMRVFCPVYGERVVYPSIHSMPLSALGSMEEMKDSKDMYEIPHAFPARDFSLYGFFPSFFFCVFICWVFFFILSMLLLLLFFSFALVTYVCSQTT